MPSVRSLQERQYYGHPQNRFWPLMGELFGAGPELPYPHRTEILIEHGIAVWDVLASCQRPGSLDTAIERSSEIANPIDTLLRDQPSIRRIVFNGRAAEQLFRRHLQTASADIECIALPSTSPANAAFALPRLLEHWRPALSP